MAPGAGGYGVATRDNTPLSPAGGRVGKLQPKPNISYDATNIVSAGGSGENRISGNFSLP